MSRADALTPAEINRVLRTCVLMPHSEAKRCALVLSHAAMRVTEIALLRTEHVLFANGKIRDEIHLPANICKFLKPRTVWLSNRTSRAIIQEWVNHRLTKKMGCLWTLRVSGVDPRITFSVYLTWRSILDTAETKEARIRRGTGVLGLRLARTGYA